MAVERGVDLFDRRGAGLVFPIIDAVVLDPVVGREHAGEIGVTEITQRIAVRHAIPEDHDRVGTRWIDTTETGGGERRGIAEIAAAERAPVGIAADRAIGADVAARFAIALDEHEAAAIELLAEGAAEFVIGQITAARNTVAALDRKSTRLNSSH